MHMILTINEKHMWFHINVCMTGGKEPWDSQCPQAGGLSVGQESGRRDGC